MDFLKHIGIDFGNYNYTIPIGYDFKLNFWFELKLLNGFEFGFNLFSSKKNAQIYIDLYIEAGLSISAEFGYFLDFNKFGFLKIISDLLKLIINITDIKENLNLWA